MPTTGTGAAPVKEADHGRHRALELVMIVPAIGLPFGPDRLTQTARNLGQGIREVRPALHEGRQPDNSHATQEPSAGRPRER